MVEMAFILPLLLLIVFAICEFGWALYVSNTLNRAAREGARYAAVLTRPIVADDPRIIAKVKANLTFGYSDVDLSVVTVPPPVTANPTVEVKVNLIYHTFTGLFPSLDGKALHGTAAMRYEL